MPVPLATLVMLQVAVTGSLHRIESTPGVRSVPVAPKMKLTRLGKAVAPELREWFAEQASEPSGPSACVCLFPLIVYPKCLFP